MNTIGPGFLYYGINAADRGLGYQGSYMTLGGFVPTVEDDLGGLWSADVRGHLSTYAGFFSNLGMVRKQFIGGSLLGLGVYWDYDGDMNQYPDQLVPGTTYVFPGGATYNQIGISGEWLTDWGNLRSNGYIPLGSTALLVGPFLQNSLLCQNGVNAALGGADLEVGAYIPGLSDWAGMISVGGYAYGNSRYSFDCDSVAVPWFGGVYTRLDMTFMQNWDFSLQANNDSYFDWTGFARLTYRMGGSRRRNVPDQMEQPMMRNEHIVRAHRVPEVAVNPANGLPWTVYHVDNSAAAGGNGTAEAPYTTLAQVMARPVNAAYDIVYVHHGNSASSPYITPVTGYSFGAANQYLIGQGSAIALPTLGCGNRVFFRDCNATDYPIMTNPIGPAIVINQPGVNISHVSIVNSPLGITDAGSVPAASGIISDVLITGNGGITTGVEIANSDGSFTFDNVQLSSLSNDGFRVSAAGANVAISNSSITAVTGRAIAVTNSGTVAATTTRIEDTTGTAIEASGALSRVVLTSGTIADTTGVAVLASGSAAVVQITDERIDTTTGSALVASGNNAQIRGLRLAMVNTGSATGSSAAVVSGSGAIMTIDSSLISNVGANGVTISGTAAQFFMTGGSIIENTELYGLLITGSDATVLVQDSILRSITGDGVYVQGYDPTSLNTFANTQVTVQRSRILGTQGHGIYAEGVNSYSVSGTTAAGSTVQVLGSQITGTVFSGVAAVCSNVLIDRDSESGQITSIQGTGPFGVEVTNQLSNGTTQGASRVSVAYASIAGVVNGINVSSIATTAANTVSITALSNNITASGDGIVIAAAEDTPAATSSFVNADILSNRITAGGDGIQLTTANTGLFGFNAPPLRCINIQSASNQFNLAAVNFFATVNGAPAGAVGYNQVGRVAELPPDPPVPTVPPTP